MQLTLDQAIKSYKKALSLKSDYAEYYRNLYGTSGNIEEAKRWIEECIKANPDHLKAKFTISALQFYAGNKSDFIALLKSQLKNHPYMRSFNLTFSLPKLPSLYFHRWALFDQMIEIRKRIDHFTSLVFGWAKHSNI